MRGRRILLGTVVLAGLAVAGGFALTWRPAIDPVDPAARPAADRAAVVRGAQLAAIGNCATCHTAPGGKPYAGGAPVATPFGTIYGTNITPDPETGIGRWSEAAFRRALRDGVDRAGNHLYPAFPYDHFTKLADGDIAALHAFLTTREPVRATTPPNALPFPLNARPILAGWKLLFLDRRRFRPTPDRDEAWNRGAYLTESLAHCGACHTPRNILGAERRERTFAGGSAGGWYAPALNDLPTAPTPWTAERIFAYLRRGADDLHGAAAGPMAPVSHALARVPEADVRAIAVYVASLVGPPPLPKAPAGEPAAGPGQGSSEGAAIHAAACAGCHQGSGPRGAGAAGVPLGLSSAVAAPDPRNLIHFILEGVHPAEGEAGPLMPGFADALTDGQIAALADWLRTGLAGQPAWTDVAATVRRIRQGKQTSGKQTS